MQRGTQSSVFSLLPTFFLKQIWSAVLFSKIVGFIAGNNMCMKAVRVKVRHLLVLKKKSFAEKFGMLHLTETRNGLESLASTLDVRVP